MKSLSVVVLAIVLAVAHGGVLAPAPVFYAASHPAHVVGPLALPHPISYAAPAKVVYSPAVYAAPVVPVVKHVYATPVVKHVSYAAHPYHGVFL